MLILGRPDVTRALEGREDAILDTVTGAYIAHAHGQTAVPHSLFLRFPGDERNRIIALPAFVGGARPVAGMKWISSFPGNTGHGIERASAAILLNSLATGHPEAMLEGSSISAWRTAASAAVAARRLVAEPDVRAAALIGCGVINFEILRFLRIVFPALGRVTVFDLDGDRSRRFVDRVAPELAGVEVEIAGSLQKALAAHALVSFATTAGGPHADTAPCSPGTVVLHVSLRDLSVESILGAVNVVDDTEHVCRERTSLDLAQQSTGHRRFVHAEIGGLLAGDTSFEPDPERVTIFSPFGLGALDVAVADLARRRAEELGLGTRVDDFLATAPAAAVAK